MTDDSPVVEAVTLQAVAARQDQLASTVRMLAQTVRRLASSRAEGGGDKTAPSYTGADLVDWVTWFTERYELGTLIPNCWPCHGALVEELAALYVGWLDATTTTGMAHTMWHDYLGRALDRIDGRWRTCTDGRHRQPEPADWLASGPRGADDLDPLGDRYTRT